MTEDLGIKIARKESEREAKAENECNSCGEDSKGSRSESTGTEFAYCAKCITRATPAADSYACSARGNDPGPFTDL